MTQVCELSAALRQQWAMLQERINELTSATLEQPSTLEGWTVRELIAHLTCSLGLIGRCEVLGPPALDAGVSPQTLSLGDYLGSYSPDSASIAAHGRREAQRLGSDIAEAVHAEMDQALAHLPQIEAGGDHGLIRTTRGVLTARDFLLTRVIEAVVHTYDLAPALPPPPPVDPHALHWAAQGLLSVLNERLGCHLIADHPELWVKVASGRLEWSAVAAKEPLRPEYLSDGIPDLESSLPLL